MITVITMAICTTRMRGIVHTSDLTGAMTSSCSGSLRRGSWSKEEDRILAAYVEAHGPEGWTKVPKKAGLNRCGKSCRLRWLNYLRPNIKRGNITEDEEDLIIRLHRFLGNRWSLIAGRLPGRTDNEIKNYWNTVLKKKVHRGGSDQAHELASSSSERSEVARNKEKKGNEEQVQCSQGEIAQDSDGNDLSATDYFCNHLDAEQDVLNEWRLGGEAQQCFSLDDFLI